VCFTYKILFMRFSKHLIIIIMAVRNQGIWRTQNKSSNNTRKSQKKWGRKKQNNNLSSKRKQRIETKVGDFKQRIWYYRFTFFVCLFVNSVHCYNSFCLSEITKTKLQILRTEFKKMQTGTNQRQEQPPTTQK
jgi:hypothetical protein